MFKYLNIEPNPTKQNWNEEMKEKLKNEGRYLRMMVEDFSAPMSIP